MTINELYITMGELGLYQLRDKLLEWKKENNYTLKTEITDDIVEKMPNSFIFDTYRTQLERKLTILRFIYGIQAKQ